MEMKSLRPLIMLVAGVAGGAVLLHQIMTPGTRNEVIMLSSSPPASEEQTINDSRIIILGTIIDGLVNSWNQNSGKRWDMASGNRALRHPPAAFPVQTMRVDVSEVWRADGKKIPDPIEIVIIGTALGRRYKNNIGVPNAGNKVVVFLSRKKIGWRDGIDGRREVITMANPLSDLYIVNEDETIMALVDISNTNSSGGLDRSSNVNELKGKVSQ